MHMARLLMDAMPLMHSRNTVQIASADYSWLRSTIKNMAVLLRQYAPLNADQPWAILCSRVQVSWKLAIKREELCVLWSWRSDTARSLLFSSTKTVQKGKKQQAHEHWTRVTAEH